QDSQHRIKAMALVHQQLDESSNLAQIDLTTYLRQLMAHLSRSFAPQVPAISWQVNGPILWVGVDAAIGCGLIIHELASNSFKHAFPDGRVGEILIDLSEEPDQSVRLRLSDDGVGLPKNLDFLQTQSLGL